MLLQKTPVKHEVNHHTRNRNIEPNREGNRAIFPVFLEVPFQSRPQGDDGLRQAPAMANGVWGPKDRKIGGSGRPHGPGNR